MLRSFDLPHPQDFRTNPEREWALNAAETAEVLRLARQEGLPPEGDFLELRRARMDKYDQAKEANYRWKLSYEPEPRELTFDEMKAWFFAEARDYPNLDFIMDDTNSIIVRRMCLYFANDPRFETESGGSLRKGLLLRGRVGCGKTTLLSIFSRNPRLPYRMKRCRELVGDCIQPGPGGQPAGGLESLAGWTKCTNSRKASGGATITARTLDWLWTIWAPKTGKPNIMARSSTQWSTCS